MSGGRAHCSVLPYGKPFGVTPVMFHRLVGLVLVAAIFALAPLAHASPPDQTWIAGLYDNADFDDVIQYVTGGLGAVQPSLASSARVVTVVVGLVTPMDTTTRALFSLSSDFSRAPPLV